jgi:hypothetical protein
MNELENKFKELMEELKKGISTVVGRAAFIMRLKYPFDPYLPFMDQMEVLVSSRNLSEATEEQVDGLIKFCEKWKEILQTYKKFSEKIEERKFE